MLSTLVYLVNTAEADVSSAHTSSKVACIATLPHATRLTVASTVSKMALVLKIWNHLTRSMQQTRLLVFTGHNV